MKILIACERSQVVCSAFRAVGVEAYSNDILPCLGSRPDWHIMEDARKVVKGSHSFRTEFGNIVTVHGSWDMIIAHPPCTMLTHSSAVALSQGKHTMDDIEDARRFFLDMLNAPAPRVAVENPAPLSLARLPRYDQIVQPYEFGHPYSKRVCLWLRNLPPLIPQRGYYTEHEQWLKHCASTQARRARTFDGIAEAMASQWGDLLTPENM